MKGLGGRFGQPFPCWRCRRAAARLRRHTGIFATGGARALLDEIAIERQRATARGIWKRQMMFLAEHHCRRMGWPIRMQLGMPRRSSLPLSLIEYPLPGLALALVYPSGPTLRRLH